MVSLTYDSPSSSEKYFVSVIGFVLKLSFAYEQKTNYPYYKELSHHSEPNLTLLKESNHLSAKFVYKYGSDIVMYIFKLYSYLKYCEK